VKKILIDTSVWIEFFAAKSKLSIFELQQLSLEISEGLAVLINPIRVELLSGHIAPELQIRIDSLLDAIDMIDLDWNQANTWNEIINLANNARQNNLPIPGLVDRMILLSAAKSDVILYSLDKTLIKLAKAINISTRFKD
jgi:predicted nucleic acid-binding protein